MDNNYIRWFDTLRYDDVPTVGGKNASLGEMYFSLKEKKIDVPNGFATTSLAYMEFLKFNKLDEKISSLVKALQEKKASLQKTGKEIRSLILKGKFPEKIKKDILIAYTDLCKFYKKKDVDVAVRSSATAEDLPEASFAGQQESYLNVRGEEMLIKSCIRCYASLFTDRAISYREEKGFGHTKIALSIGIQKMVRSDKAGSGVMFTLDTDTGFREVVIINAAFGLGENVVQGAVNPDEYIVFKPLLDQPNIFPIIEKKLGRKEKKMIYKSKSSTKNIKTSKAEQDSFVLSDEEILKLGSWGKTIEDHYKKPMDIEWAKDGETNQLFIVQARPETVQSQTKASSYKTYQMVEKGKEILKGLAIGEAIASGKVQVIKNIKDIEKFEEGSILVTEITSPDWVPIMKKAKGIITDHGGRTSHAAIVSRELRVPAIVGTNNATKILKHGQNITMSCVQGDEGIIYDGLLKYSEEEIDLSKLPKVSTQLMINIASPDGAFHWWHLPCKGIGLARMEFIINNIIKIHPMALVHFDKINNKKTKKIIAGITRRYKDKKKYFIENLSLSIGKIAASQYPYPVIVRMSDFKTNEYANLIGGEQFEFQEDNPMIGFRGASRYYNKRYREGFNLECAAIKKVREEIGLKNVIIMIPFCRTLEEADKVLEVLAENNLKRGENDLKIYVMAEIPSNIILAKEFAQRFDGFSIGSNDLTQLTLGIDRDSEELASLFDERNEAVKRSIEYLIKTAKENNCKVGICGQGPSDHSDFAEFLVKLKIDSMSLNPDSIIKIINHIAKIEKD